MKYELSSQPANFKESWPGQFQTFSWMEFTASIPQAISVITTWKEGKIPNACLQSWTTYTGDGAGFYVIFSVMNSTHTYKNILRAKDFVVNFPGQGEFQKCFSTIKNNNEDMDEIAASGLTVEPSRRVDAPRIKECFLNLECRLEWEKPLHEGSRWHLFAGKVQHVAIDNENTQRGSFGRCGPKGFIYNIHSPIDPGTGVESDSMIGSIAPIRKM